MIATLFAAGLLVLVALWTVAYIAVGRAADPTDTGDAV